MSKFIPFDEVLRKWGIKPFEIFPHLQNGLQPYSEESGNRIPCPRSYHAKTIIEKKRIRYGNRGKDLINLQQIKNDMFDITKNRVEPKDPRCDRYYNAIRHLDDAKRAVGEDKPSDAEPLVITIFHPHKPNPPKIVCDFEINTLKRYLQQISGKITKLWAEQKEIEKDDPDCQLWKYFRKPTSEEEVKEIISDLKTAVFKADEVGKIAEAIAKTDEPMQFDAFVRNLRVYYVNDDEIKIQEPGEQAKPADLRIIGFKTHKTKEWKTFRGIIQNFPHTFSIDDEAARKLYGEINKKLIGFINKEFQKDIPLSFKLYKRIDRNGEKVFRFKFRVNAEGAESAIRSPYEGKPKEKLISMLKRMVDTYRKKPEDYLGKKINQIRSDLIEIHGMNEDEVKEIIFPISDEQTILDQFSDFRPDSLDRNNNK